MLDHHDREKFAAIYRLLADVLEHEAGAAHNEEAMSYRLGDLAGRLFMGPPAEPPDELLETAVHVLRTGGAAERQQLSARLRSSAEQLDRGAAGA